MTIGNGANNGNYNYHYVVDPDAMESVFSDAVQAVPTDGGAVRLSGQ